MIVQINGPYSISTFFILFQDLVYCLKITVVHTTLLNCQCNVFWPCIAIIIVAFFKKDCSYRNNFVIRLHDVNLEHSLMNKSKNRCSYVFLHIFMFRHSRFSLRNLEDANSCMFSWCITTSSLLICSWHDMTLSQFVQYLQ